VAVEGKKGRIATLVVMAGAVAAPTIHEVSSDRPRVVDDGRVNVLWLAALKPYPERYASLTREQKKAVQALEIRYGELLDALTAVDGMGGDHGRYHVTKPETERGLWQLLKNLPRYPAAPRMIMAALDDVYLGYHANGWWGPWWHWPYFHCEKASELAVRMAKDYPELEEEALWTRIYCHRIQNWSDIDSRRASERGAESPWKADPDQLRILGAQLLQKFPDGKYAARVKQLFASENPMLTLPGYPVMGRTPPGGGMAMTVRRYDGPEFLIDRSPR
jgi:hypothetical protein